jgi:tetratricopeptide (TPR) repeat protein
MLLNQTGRWKEAEDQLSKAMDIREQLVRNHPKDSRYRYHLVQSLIGLGSISRQTKRLDRSREFYGRALELIGRLETDHPGVFDYALIADLANSNYANLLRDSKDLDTALKHYAEATRRYEEAVRLSPNHAATRQYMLLCNRGWTKTLIALGRHREAIAVWDAAEWSDDGRYAEQIKLFRGYSWAKLGDHRRALENADPLFDDKDGSFEKVYNLACVYALAAAGTAKDASLDDSTKANLAKSCADKALKLLATARQAEPTRFAGSKNDPDLAALRGLKEFQSLYP